MNPDSLIDALQWRYATKVFDSNKKIEPELWGKIEESLVLTPSSFGLQPWQFLVITDDNVKKQLVEHSWNQTQVTDCSHHVVFAAPKTVDEEAVDRLIQTTAKLRGQDLESLQGYREMMLGFIERMSVDEIMNWASKQSYIALGQLMTCAAVLGVDACPMEGFLPLEYDRILGLEEKGLTAVVCCAMGYRSEEDKYATASKIRYTQESTITHV